MGCGGLSCAIVGEKANTRGVIYDEDILQFVKKAKNSTCKIINEEGYGAGFFC